MAAIKELHTVFVYDQPHTNAGQRDARVTANDQVTKTFGPYVTEIGWPTWEALDGFAWGGRFRVIVTTEY